MVYSITVPKSLAKRMREEASAYPVPARHVLAAMLDDWMSRSKDARSKAVIEAVTNEVKARVESEGD